MVKKNKFEKTKKSFLFLLSVIGFLIIGWLLFYGKIKAVDFFAPILGKIPRNESSLIKATENILGTAVEKIKGGGLQATFKKGSEVFETSTFTEPARNVRDDVKAKIDLQYRYALNYKSYKKTSAGWRTLGKNQRKSFGEKIRAQFGFCGKRLDEKIKY